MKLLFVSFFHPNAEKNGAAMRSSSIIRAVRALGHKVIVVGLTGANFDQKYMQSRFVGHGFVRALRGICLAFVGLPVTGCEQIPHSWGQFVKEAVAVEKPDVVVADMLWVWPVAKNAARGIPIIYLEHNVESDVTRKLGSEEPKIIRRFLRRIDAKLVQFLERDCLRYSCLIWAVSNRDRLGRPESFQSKTWVLRNGFPIDREAVSFDTIKRFDIIFVGALSFRPNRLALEWFIANVWLPKKLGDSGWKFGIVAGGGSAPSWLLTTGVEWIGFVEDLNDVYGNTRLVVAPVFVGGGTKLKVVEALQFGLPIVAAPHAIEGLDLGHAIHVACSPAEWLSQMSDLRTADTTEERKVNHEFYKRFHDWRALQSPIVESLKTL